MAAAGYCLWVSCRVLALALTASSKNSFGPLPFFALYTNRELYQKLVRETLTDGA